MHPINQTIKNPRQSAGYNFVSTADLIQRFENQGFEIRQTLTPNVMKIENQGYQKHLIRFVKSDMINNEKLTEVPEIVLINSHNGSTAVKLLVGVYRLICSNGLIFGDTFSYESVRHVGFTYKELDAAIAATLEKFPKVLDQITLLKNKKLSSGEALGFAKRAITLRIPGNDNVLDFQFNYDYILAPKRYEEKEPSAWNILNILQEKLIQGGIPYTKSQWIDGKFISKHQTMRALKSIDRRVSINKELFNQALALVA